MAKVDLELLKLILQRNSIEVRKIAQILDDINKEQEIADEDADKEPPVKKQFVTILSDPEGYLESKEFTGWVVQIPEEDSPYTATERLIRAAYEYNTTKKGRRMPVQELGEVCEFVPAKILKEQKIWVKTKEPIFIHRTNNKIPLEKKQRRGE